MSNLSTSLDMELPASVTIPPSNSLAHHAHECMTACELASWLRVDRKTVYEYAARNVIPCGRLGKRLVFSRAAVMAWLAQSSTETPSPRSGVGQRPGRPQKRASNPLKP